MAQDLANIRNLLRRNRDELLTRSHVVAVGAGYKYTGGKKTSTLSIVCSVTKKVPASELSSRDMVPEMLNNIPTDVIETGRLRALQSPTERFRPAPGGVSIGHPEITAGTLGCLVEKNGELLILSNNHVLANSNNAQVGDPILQPGPFDGGQFPKDHIANLTQFVPITFIGEPSDCRAARTVVDLLNTFSGILRSDARLQVISGQVTDNLVDAAIARPVRAEDVSNEILEIGNISGTARGDLGMAVKKSGRTTGFTTGEILQVDVTANVQYGQNQTARFTDQLMAGPMSQGGDSGSAVLDEDNRLVGLLFAGSDQSTIINRIENVFSALGVTI